MHKNSSHFSLEYLNIIDKEYHSLLLKILDEGVWKQNRTGVKTLSIFGPQIIFKDIKNNFPLLTTKKVHLKSIIGELLWFLSGSTNKHTLKNKYGVSIWDEWGDDETGELGPIYGKQWVSWKSYDYVSAKQEDGTVVNVPIYLNQIEKIIQTLLHNPDDRRMIVTAWNPGEIEKMALPPCHWSFQFYSVKYPGNDKRTLHIIQNQRSVDVGLGLPFNIASYALLLMMIAEQVNMIPGNLIMNLGDTHIYENHLEQLYEQLSRDSKGEIPKMKIKKRSNLWLYEPGDFNLENYNPHKAIKMPVAV